MSPARPRRSFDSDGQSQGRYGRGPERRPGGAGGGRGRAGGGKNRGRERYDSPQDRHDSRRDRYDRHDRYAEPPYDEDGIRLQKILSEAGVASRRGSEALIEAGRVEVDGIRVRELGIKVDPAKRRIEVDGLLVETDPSKITLALNKPKGVVSTMDDPEDRPTLATLVESRPERLFHVGRLDRDSEGLILLTNDGALANALSHPSHEVPKTYLATVEGRVRPGVGRQLREGVELDDGFAQVDSFRLIDAIPGYTQVELTLHSGRNRIVRRLFGAVGYRVTRLVRTRVGNITLGELRPGRWRVLAGPELAALKKAAGL